MFTPDGELRDDLPPPPPKVEKPAPAAAPAPAKGAAPPPAAKTPAAPTPGAAAPASPAEAPGPRALPPVETTTDANFQDLVGLLAQTASVYLQQLGHVPLDQRAEHLELARMHIDLLAILKQKTTGNLEPMELALIDDMLYRLRLAAVERG